MGLLTKLCCMPPAFVVLLFALGLGYIRQFNQTTPRTDFRGGSRSRSTTKTRDLTIFTFINESSDGSYEDASEDSYVVIEVSEDIAGCGSGDSGSCKPPPHMHMKQSETFEILRGITTYSMEGKEVEVRVGEGHFIPPRVKHTLWTAGASDVGLKMRFKISPALNSKLFFAQWPCIFYDAGPPPYGDLATFLKRGGPLQLPMTLCAAHMHLDEPLSNTIGGDRACAVYTFVAELAGLKPFYSEYDPVFTD